MDMKNHGVSRNMMQACAAKDKQGFGGGGALEDTRPKRGKQVKTLLILALAYPWLRRAALLSGASTGAGGSLRWCSATELVRRCSGGSVRSPGRARATTARRAPLPRSQTPPTISARRWDPSESGGALAGAGAGRASEVALESTDLRALAATFELDRVPCAAASALQRSSSHLWEALWVQETALGAV